MTVLAVDGIDSLGKCRLFFTVNDIKEVGLNGIVSTDVADNYSGVLIMVETVPFPLCTKQLGGQ